MATDSSSKPSRRKPTKREVTRSTSSADSHYSKLSHSSGPRPTHRSAPRPPASSSSRSSASGAPASRRSPQRTSSPSRGQSRSSQAPQRMRPSQAKATNYESLSQDAQRRVYGNKPNRKRRRQGNASAAIIGIAVIAVFILVGFLFWSHRSVSITVNGQPEHIRVKSTIEDVHDKLDIVTKPGNYVSVSGNIIEKDKGYTFSAKLGDKDLSRKQIEEYRIKGGEDLQILDGGDRMEDYDVTYRQTQPKLVFEGSWGSVSYIKQWGKEGKQEIRTGKVSGETADGDWVEELQDCIVVTKNITPANGEKLVALTFDDGPAPTYTEAYLDILNQYGAKATFFNLSENQADYPEIAQKVAASGNQIASHTNQHLQLSTLGTEDFLYEISSAHDTIKQVSGVDTSVIRPPYGDFNQNCWLMTQGTVCASIIWNQDTLDWSVPGVDVIVQNALTDIQSGSIILMHDGGGPRDQDLEALPQIIKSLQDDGYKLVTVSELLASDPDVPRDVAAGTATMPADAIWPTEIGEATINVG